MGWWRENVAAALAAKVWVKFKVDVKCEEVDEFLGCKQEDDDEEEEEENEGNGWDDSSSNNNIMLDYDKGS